MIGVEFTLRDQTKDYYDPFEYPRDFEETDTHFIIHMHYEYEILKSEVDAVRFYELCDKCKYELYNDGCHRCQNDEEIVNL
jgi:hypothetical protein